MWLFKRFCFFAGLWYLIVCLSIGAAGAESATVSNASQPPALNLNTKTQSLVEGIKVSGYVQGKYISDEDDMADPQNQFKIFRARLKFTGELHKKINYKLMFGAYEPPPSKTAKPALVDGFMDFKFCPYGSVKAGQFFVPFGFEGPRPITKHPAIERSNVTSRQNSYAIFRDVGVNLHGKSEFFSYDLAVMNGRGAAVTNDDSAGTLRADDNKMKDFITTVRLTPSKSFMVGSSWHRGWFGADAWSRNRYSGFMSGQVSDLFYIVEYIAKIDQKKHTGDLRSQGAYLLLAYRFLKKYEPVIRGEIYDPDIAESGDLLQIMTLGFNYFPWKDVRLAVNYELKDNRSLRGPDNLFQALAQISF